MSAKYVARDDGSGVGDAVTGTPRHHDGKASFADVYDREDPRAYYETLGSLDYMEPEHGRRLFSALIEALAERKRAEAGDETIKVVNLCCSYGVDAALMKHDLTLDDLYARYRSRELAGLSGEALADADARFYTDRPGRLDGARVRVVGIDLAGNAIRYALRTGLLDEGFAVNLEKEDPTEELARAVAGADLVVATGCVGYVTRRTFDRLLRSITSGGSTQPPWVAAFAARLVDLGPLKETLLGHGLGTEILPAPTFPRRRFADREEQARILQTLAKGGVDTSGKEDAGWFHISFLLARPADETEDPVQTLLAPALSAYR